MPRDAVVTSPVTVIDLDPGDELSQLDEAARQLGVQLQSLAAAAQRLEARREVLVALNQYDKW
jgi:hypothetical protein